MSQRAELFVWLVLPYAAMVVFVAGHVWRYRRDQFGWTSRSSQMLESRLLAWGSVLFHYGAFAAIAGHVLGILVPESATSAIGISEDFYHDFSGIAGSIAGFVCLLGFGILTFRRTKVRRGDMTRIDPTTTVASLVAERPGRSREFERRSGPTGQPSRRRRAREHSAWQATAPVASSAPSTCQLYQPTASSVGIPVNSSAASFQARTRSSESQTTNASPERRSMG